MPRIDIDKTFRAASDRIAQEATTLRSMIQSMYPAFMGKIDLHGQGGRPPSQDSRFPLLQMLYAVWGKQLSLEADPPVIESVAESVVEVLERARIRIRFVAPVVNLRSEVESIRLAPSLSLRRLSEAEVTDIYGNPNWRLLFGSYWMSGIHEFVFEGEHEEPLLLEGREAPVQPPLNEVVLGMLDRATLALRAFKQGPVGYVHVLYRPIGFCPRGPLHTGHSNVLIPLGSYGLKTDEIARLAPFADHVLKNQDPALAMACQRLGDAQVRTRPEDQIIDAVIGMEAVLLSSMEPKDRGELKFRFSLNYAVLASDPAERHRRFRLAKHLYDLRSMLAHGGTLERAVRVGSGKVAPSQAATYACEALRDLLMRFLPQSSEAPHRQPAFWEEKYFGSGSASH